MAHLFFLSDPVGQSALKLIVQIPCYNEEDTLARVVEDIPRKVPGFDRVEILVRRLELQRATTSGEGDGRRAYAGVAPGESASGPDEGAP